MASAPERFALLGEQIEAWRKAAGFSSQEALAAAVGRSRTTVLRWVRGERAPGEVAIPALARALKVPQHEIRDRKAGVLEGERVANARTVLDRAAASQVPAQRATVAKEELGRYHKSRLPEGVAERLAAMPAREFERTLGDAIRLRRKRDKNR